MDDLAKVEISIEVAKKKINLATSLEQLKKNKHFKNLFTKEYQGEFALHLVERKAHVSMQSEANQKYIDGQLNAIGHLHQYLSFVEQEGLLAKESLRVDEEERENILEEAL